VFQRQIAKSGGGASVAVFHHGELVVDLWGGARDDLGTPWARDTLTICFSTTKGVMATAAHVLADRGLLDYDDRVAKHWPEFGQAGKEGITVRHVLAHQSGLYHIRQMVDHAGRMRDWNYMIRAIERTPPIHKPGTRTGYHGLTYGYLVGEIIQRVTGTCFGQLVQDEIARPLQLDGMYIGAPQEVLHRSAKLVWAPGGLISPQVLGAGAGLAGGLVMSAAGAIQSALRLAGVEFDLQSLLDALAPRGISSFEFDHEDTLTGARCGASDHSRYRGLPDTPLARHHDDSGGGQRLQRIFALRRHLCAD